MRLLVGIPSAGSPAPPFLESLAKVTFPENLTAVDRYVATGNFVPAQRELIVTQAIAVNADVLLMCDDDMILPNDALTSLLSILSGNARCGLAGALYYSRDGFRPMVVSDWNPLDTTTAIIPAFESGPVEVDGVGFGCVAIRMNAIRELEPPYFSAHVYLEPGLGKARVCNEDYLFCHRLRERGWSVVLHAGVRAGHYDRATQTTFPREWEPLERTSIPRMAAMRDGIPQLLPASKVPTHGEFHRRICVEYITPKD